MLDNPNYRRYDQISTERDGNFDEALVLRRASIRLNADALAFFRGKARGVPSTLVGGTVHMMGIAVRPAIALRSLAVLLCIALAISPFSAWAYTPESPKVQQMLGRAVAYLASGPAMGEHAGQLGGRCLIGLALYKYHKRFGDGTMPELTRAALGSARAEGRNPQSPNSTSNYSLGIALIFLTEVEPTSNTLEISNLLDELAKRQKPNGGWGYPEPDDRRHVADAICRVRHVGRQVGRP